MAIDLNSQAGSKKFKEDQEKNNKRMWQIIFGVIGGLIAFILIFNVINIIRVSSQTQKQIAIYNEKSARNEQFKLENPLETAVTTPVPSGTVQTVEKELTVATVEGNRVCELQNKLYEYGELSATDGTAKVAKIGGDEYDEWNYLVGNAGTAPQLWFGNYTTEAMSKIREKYSGVLPKIEWRFMTPYGVDAEKNRTFTVIFGCYTNDSKIYESPYLLATVRCSYNTVSKTFENVVVEYTAFGQMLESTGAILKDASGAQSIVDITGSLNTSPDTDTQQTDPSTTPSITPPGDGDNASGDLDESDSEFADLEYKTRVKMGTVDQRNEETGEMETVYVYDTLTEDQKAIARENVKQGLDPWEGLR